MKILAWLIFLTSTACFVIGFCRQQCEAELADSTVAFSKPCIEWLNVDRRLNKEAQRAQSVSATTQPADAQADPRHAIEPTIAATDLDDATR